jgi:DNA (cytosine-5)-methyltransferase 1
MKAMSVGSICSGIEAASVAWAPLKFKFEWFSEISAFPAKLLQEKYAETPNLGDMCDLPNKITQGDVPAPDIICGGTPCQAFSLAGWKKGLEDVRGNLTLKFVDIINANDQVRQLSNNSRTIVFWENVEGVLRDKTNAFGCLLASLGGYDDEIQLVKKWPQSGMVRGPLRNIAWRVIDAKYFGLPQQRKRLYLLAGGKDFNPEDILFEIGKAPPEQQAAMSPLEFTKDGHSIEIFRSYTDCLYSAYGTKWNGNAAAYNGSLFICQNGRLRRLSPLECERLMGFPDNYTALKGAKFTSRYQATGNSWSVPVVRWLGRRIIDYREGCSQSIFEKLPNYLRIQSQNDIGIWELGKAPVTLSNSECLNGTLSPCQPTYGNMENVVDVNADEKLYLTPVGCKGILRRKDERGLPINPRLESILREISSTWSDDEIEIVSRKQARGRFSVASYKNSTTTSQPNTLPLWDEEPVNTTTATTTNF